jgi:hypothetical protein
VVNVLRFQDYLIDDAYISLRYARNFVDGHGLVFNPGERVEGYTNFLWVLLGALAMKIGIEPMLALKVVSFLATLVLLVVLARLDRDGEAGFPNALLWLLPVQAFAYWATAGMETAFFTTILVIAVGLALQENRAGAGMASVLVFALLAHIRPDGVVFFGLCQLVFLLVHRWRRGDWPLRRTIRNVLLFALLCAPYFIWRWRWYGELLPNTFTAKVTGGEGQIANGWFNLRQWAGTAPLFALAIVSPVALAWPGLRSRFREHPHLLEIGLIAAGCAAYPVVTGGDTMAFHRLYVPVLAFGALVLSGFPAVLVPGLPDRTVRRLRLAAVALLIVNTVAGFWNVQASSAFLGHRMTERGLEVGRFFRQTLGKDELMAMNTVGAVPYASGLPTIDMLGLTDSVVARSPVFIVSAGWGAHSRGFGEYVLSRRPRAVIWYNMAGYTEPYYLGDHQLADSPTFRFFYQHRRIFLPFTEDPARPLVVFPGAPYGKDGEISSDMGIRIEVHDRPVRYTVVRPSPVEINYFERRDVPSNELWGVADACSGDTECFVNAVADLWKRAGAPPVSRDPDAALEVDRLCRESVYRLGAGDREGAKRLLSEAQALNASVGSPLVNQYIANLAVEDKNLFLAVQAQREALRLKPDDPIYRRNLKALLTTPYRNFRH